jgi:hypothetical protein
VRLTLRRYTRILAPQLKVFDDARVAWRADEGGPEVTVISPGGSDSSSSGGRLRYG